MLTRQEICSGRYLENFESLPNLWSSERIENSLIETMKLRPADASDIWVFGYGSLIWNPMIHFDTRQVATLHEWHRSFCLSMTVGRGSPETPGRMLALETGGHTDGVALKLRTDTLDEELRLLWIREMVLGSYMPTWAPVTLSDGATTHAITFVIDETRAQFERDSTVSTVAPLIASASGKFGTNAEYLFQLHAVLDEYGLHDPYIDALADKVLHLSLQTP